MRVAWALLLNAVACQQSPHASPERAASAAAASTPPSSASAATVAAPAKAWFEGAWQGTYRAELFRVEVPAGGVKDWKLDDGKQASGDGKLLLQAAADGAVTGTASGALGDLLLVGHIDGDRIALVLSSGSADGFHGFGLATHAGDAVQGTLTASRGDSLQARQATLTLTRAAP